MQKIDILFKAISLKYRETMLNEAIKDNENSNALIRNVLNTIDVNGKTKLNGGISDVIENLKNYVNTLLDEDVGHINKHMIIESVKLIFDKDSGNPDTLEKSLMQDMTIEETKKNILILKKYLNNYYRESEIRNLLSKASYTFNKERNTINNKNDYIGRLITSLEELTVTNGKDDSISKEVDLGSEDTVSGMLNTVKEELSNDGKLRTGWQALNRMLSGGFRRGEMFMVSALQHKYKSGFTLSMFAQLAMYNTPVMLDESKKPLMVLFSLEDEVELALKSLFEYLYYDEHKEMPDMVNITTKDASAYIKKRMSVTGYHVKILRVDPTSWSFKQLTDKVYGYEAEGYELHAAFIDYLSLIPTTGCITTGPGGTDLRDLFRRVRNFFSVRKTFVLTPHQLSTEAKQLSRNGVSDALLVKEVANKGYYSGSKQLDQEVDGGLVLHIAKINGKKHLTVQREKHRGAPIIDEELMYFGLPFPNKAPIPSDINGEDISYNDSGLGGNQDSFF